MPRINELTPAERERKKRACKTRRKQDKRDMPDAPAMVGGVYQLIYFTGKEPRSTADTRVRLTRQSVDRMITPHTDGYRAAQEFLANRTA